MTLTIQPGTHPDAESLTAFAEQLLPEAEREQVLVHMATCSRCREVVFLARSAEEPLSVRRTETIATKPRGSWFTGWRWAWVPVAAVAGFVGVAVVQHVRHAESKTQMTAKLSPSEAPRNAEPAMAPAPSPQSAISPMAELQKRKRAQPSEVRDAQPRREKEEAEQLDLKKSGERKDQSMGAAGSLVGLAPGVSGGPMHGTGTANAKSAPYGGPAAVNQFQQQNQTQDNLAQENNLRQSQNAVVDAANKPDIASPPPPTAAQSVTVQAESTDVGPVSPPSASPQTSSIPLTGRNVAALSAGRAGDGADLDKIQMTLPSGLGALSAASESGRDVALDTAGRLFLSEDAGKHWQSIQTQWSGRAVLVRTRPIGKDNDALRTPRTARFELVNDKLQTWFSYDGKTWTAQPNPQD